MTRAYRLAARIEDNPGLLDTVRSEWIHGLEHAEPVDMLWSWSLSHRNFGTADLGGQGMTPYPCKYSNRLLMSREAKL